MNTYLLTWNPDKWQRDDIDYEIDELERLGIFKGRWSCGNSKSIKIGDRLFLIKIGRQNPKGICASGYAVSNVLEDEHWDGTKGKKANYVDIDFDIILNPDQEKILDLETLQQIEPNINQLWTPQQSGITIHPTVADAVEKIWFNFLNATKTIRSNFFDTKVYEKDGQQFIEGNSYQTTVTKYERNPYARQECFQHYGTSCTVCGFSFENIYGDIGHGFIHIHHLTPISEIKSEYKLNPVNDLRPVCPNCHAMIHRRKPALTIDELKAKIKSGV